MKNAFFLVMVLALPLICGTTAANGSDIKSGVRDAVSDTISAGKDVVSGFVEGVQEGRKSGDGHSQARLVKAGADLDQFKLRLEVKTVERKEPGIYEITLALHNPNDFPVRLVNLYELRNVVLLDKDGFSYALTDPLVQGRDVTALGRSATRLRYTFSGVEARPATFRLYGTDVAIP